MLSVTRLLCGCAAQDSAARQARCAPEGRPVVVWNLTRSCPLSCGHCYSDSGAGAHPGELATGEAVSVIDGLADFKVPAIIFSGGDPLARPDIFELMERASARGIRAVLSTSGVLVDDEAARRVKGSGAAYAGVSLDGREEVSDRLRGAAGAFKKTISGLRRLKALGVPVGIRFTMSARTIAELPFIFDIIESEGADRGYFAHLVPSGRAGAEDELGHAEARKAVKYIFGHAEALAAKGCRTEIVTGSNDADGAHLYLRLRGTQPGKAEQARAELARRGGNSSGRAIGCIGSDGSVHPDQFWTNQRLGSVRDRPFGEIWTDPSCALLASLRDRKRLLKGRCGSCRFLDICAGGYRVRAELATGDVWAQEPACYLTDAEVMETDDIMEAL